MDIQPKDYADYNLPIYVLLDEEGNPVRYFNWQAPNTVKVKKPKFNLDDFEEALF